MNVNRQDHRKSMVLLSLRLRLKQGLSDPKERKDIEKRIRQLEKELELD